MMEETLIKTDSLKAWLLAARPKTLSGAAPLLVGFGQSVDRIHSPNESMDLEVWENGIVAVAEFYKAFSNNVNPFLDPNRKPS